MPSPKRTPAPRKASGQNIENWQRHTVQILLRLAPDAAKLLRLRAYAEGLTISAYVARLVSDHSGSEDHAAAGSSGSSGSGS